MNTSATIKYSIKTTFKSISPFYLTVIVLYMFFMILNQGSTKGTLGSWDIMAMFVAIGAASAFKERFHFLLQHGYSRKTIFINFLITFLVISICMALFETILVVLSKYTHVAYHPLYENIYQMRYAVNGNSLQYLEGTLWHTFAFLGVMSTTFLGTIVYYRCNKQMRIILFMILPTVLFLGLPILDFSFFDGRLTYQVLTFTLSCLGLYQSDPYLAMASFIILSIIFLAASYVILRKTNLQK